MIDEAEPNKIIGPGDFIRMSEDRGDLKKGFLYKVKSVNQTRMNSDILRFTFEGGASNILGKPDFIYDHRLSDSNFGTPPGKYIRIIYGRRNS